MQTDTLYRSDHLEILCHNPQAPNAVVVFDHRHPRKGGFAQIRPSNTITNAGFSYITVASRKNDWFLSPSLADCQGVVCDYMARYGRIVGFGSSMGGYGVLALSRAFRFKQVMLVSPQITVFPDKPPFDPRFKIHAKTLDPQFDVADKSPRKGLRGVILLDPAQALDLAHTRLIAGLFPRLKPVPLPFSGHPALGVFTQAKQFQFIQKELIANNISAGRILAHYKTLRAASPDYLSARAGYLERRNARIIQEAKT